MQPLLKIETAKRDLLELTWPIYFKFYFKNDKRQWVYLLKKNNLVMEIWTFSIRLKKNSMKPYKISTHLAHLDDL